VRLFIEGAGVNPDGFTPTGARSPEIIGSQKQPPKWAEKAPLRRRPLPLVPFVRGACPGSRMI
jgi:hypothetical protein